LKDTKKEYIDYKVSMIERFLSICLSIFDVDVIEVVSKSLSLVLFNVLREFVLIVDGVVLVVSYIVDDPGSDIFD
jgi:hypothetical protein